MSKPKLLFVLSNHRTSEKIIPIIPKLSKEYEIDLFRIGLWSLETPWVGDSDERSFIIRKYEGYCNKIINGPEVKFHGGRITTRLSEFMDLSEYNVVLLDDNRKLEEFNISQFYQDCKQYNIPVIGNSHGNEDNPQNHPGVSYDTQMVLGRNELKKIPYGIPGGIPANDSLEKLDNKHILVIANFLSCRNSPFPINFDEKFYNISGIEELSKAYNLPLKIKIKPRLDYPNYQDEVNYLKSFFKGEVIVNCNDIDTLIGESTIVIGAPSTLMFKPIQIGIPTILIRGSGAIGNFQNYEGLVDLDRKQIWETLDRMAGKPTDSNYISNIIEGGEDLTSTQKYITNLKQYLNEYRNNSNI